MSAREGRLEDQDVPELLRTLARAEASGRLTLTRRDGQAILAFRRGRIIYAASPSLRESFGHILVLRGLLSEADLLAALSLQQQAEPPKRLGQLLVDLGKVDAEALREVMRQQTEDVLRELLRWKTGSFRFEPVAFAPGGEIEVDLKDFVLADGLDPQDVLGDTAPPFPTLGPPRARSEADTGPFPKAVPVGEALPVAPAAAVTAEITLRLLRYASQIFNRGVLFVVRGEEVRGIGQFGVQVIGRSPSDVVRETALPLGEPSVLRNAMEKRKTWRGRLDGSRWNLYLAQRLGGAEPAEAVVLPMIVDGAVALLFYGDNLPDLRPIGPVDALEFMITECALAMERTKALP